MFKVASKSDIRNYAKDFAARVILVILFFPTFAYSAPIGDQNSALVTAAAKGEIDLVKSLLKQKVSADAKDQYGWTAIKRAASNDRKEIVKLLIEVNANVNATKAGYTPLSEASGRGAASAGPIGSRAEIVKLLLAANSNVNTKDEKGKTPLMEAVSSRHTEIVRLLIEAKADVNAKHNDGETAIYNSAGCLECARLLISAKANVKTKTAAGVSILMTASGYDDQAEFLKLLIEAGATVNEKGQGTTALIRQAEIGSTDGMAVLITAKANVNAKDWEGRTALMHSVFKFNEEGVKLLLSAKADVNAKDKGGQTALWFSANIPATEIFTLLLKARANINVKNGYGITPLMAAASNNYGEKIVKILIAKKADVNAKDKKGNSVLTHAIKGGNAETIKILNEAGAKE